MNTTLRSTNLLFVLLLVPVLMIKAQEVRIIPRPSMLAIAQGEFIITPSTPVMAGLEAQPEARYLISILDKAFGKTRATGKKGHGIALKLDPSLTRQLGEEGYRLSSTTDGVIISAATRTGIFYGIQTLRQLLPSDFEFNSREGKTAAVPALDITDRPRFSWRAFMLDEARNFQGAAVVKMLLDQMALLKMNVFHWHLTDDQGWRLEIKKYPRLTSVGAFRKDTQKSRHSTEFTGDPHNGSYTQDQVRDILRYAAARHIRIVPEIEMPGHATAAIVAYPWLGTLGTDKEVPCTFGKMPDSYNVADGKVYRFLEDVLLEVFRLFPGNVVHIGGDEVLFDAWKKSTAVQAMMKEKGLRSPADVQIFFTNQISHFIDGQRHRMMGWNEIMGGNVHEWQKPEDEQASQHLAPSAIIHFWKGNLDLIQKAVSQGYDVVNSYHAQTYLDYDYQTIPLSKAYDFDPVPAGLDSAYESKILGSGCQMWGEWLQSAPKLQSQVFPRIAAYAEDGWTPKGQKNFQQFVTALSGLKERWTLEGIVFNDEVK